jgi:hypothetical protein
LVPGIANQFKLKFQTFPTDIGGGDEVIDKSSGSILLPRHCKPPVKHPPHMYDAKAVCWTLIRDHTPIYAIQPSGAFSEEAYEEMATFLLDQLGDVRERLDYYYYQIAGTKIAWVYNWDPCFNADDCPFSKAPAAPQLKDACNNYRNENKIPRNMSGRVVATHVAVPGTLSGTVTLPEGHVLDVINPDMRGTANWSLRRMFEGQLPDHLQLWVDRVSDRLFEEIRNPGRSGNDRALNHASVQLLQFISRNITKFVDPSAAPPLELELDGIRTAPAKSVRANSEPYTVEVSFLDPSNVERASVVVSITIDVSDSVPVVVDGPRDFRRRP